MEVEKKMVAHIEQQESIQRVFLSIIVLAPLGTFKKDGKQGTILCSIDTHVSTDTHCQNKAGACGSSSVTVACSQGGDALGIAPHIGEACLSWP